MNAISIHRAAYWLHTHNIPFFPKILQIIIFIIYNSYIPYQVKIGYGTKFGHRGISVIINKDTIIGNNVLIRAHVTIGKKYTGGKAPIIGDKVSIGDGAKIIGDVIVGENAQIGANAVVLTNIPPNSIAVGVPARILHKKDNEKH